MSRLQQLGIDVAKSTVIITGASSGLGLQLARVLAATGQWHILMACRDLPKAQAAAERMAMNPEDYTILELDLASLASVRQFVQVWQQRGERLDALVCNAAIYTPTAKEPRRTLDGYELSVGTNHLGHFLLINLLLKDLSQGTAPKLLIIGTVTHNPKELGGSIPPRPDLGDLKGLAVGFKETHTMIDDGEYNPVKAYKDSKVCNLLTMVELHRRYHQSSGITFSSPYPGCIATSGLFRESPRLFQIIFPFFQKYITRGFVSEEESGRRVAEVLINPEYDESGVYWSWRNDGKPFVNRVSEEVTDQDKAERLWALSAQLVGL